MVDPEFVPTEDELNAAREVLRRYPQLFDGRPPPDAELIVAEVYRRTGADRFNLQYGFRQPVNALEECDLKWIRGQITDEEAAEFYTAYASREVDDEMLRTLFEEAERRIECYSRFLGEFGHLLKMPRRPSRRDLDEERLDRLVDEMRFESRLFNDEAFTALEFLQESRIEKGLSIAKAGDLLAGTAVELTYKVSRTVYQN